MEVVEESKYLGVHLDGRLDWIYNTNAVYEKGQSRLYHLRRLGSCGVCSKMCIFYKSFVKSAVLSVVICWGSSVRASDLKKLNKLIKTTGSVLDCSGVSGADSEKKDI